MYKSLYNLYKNVILYCSDVRVNIVGDGIMTHENKKLAVSGVAGVLVALILITSIFTFLVPEHTSCKVLLSISTGGPNEGELLKLEGPKGIIYERLIDFESLERGTCVLNVTLYEFSRPLGVGSEADLVVTLTSYLNESEVYFVAGWIGAFSVESGSTIVDHKLPARGLSFVNESSRWVWTGNVDPNSSKTFNLRVKATEVATVLLEIVASPLRIREHFTGETIDWLRWDPEYIFPLNYNPSREARFSFIILRNNILVRSLDLPLVKKDGEWTYPPRVLLGMETSPSVWPSIWPPPYSIETEFNLTITMEPYTSNSIDVTMRLFFDPGIALVEGQTTWTGNITSEPYEAVTLPPMKIRFIQVGIWYIYAYVEKDEIIIGGPKMIQFKVTNDSITWYPM